MHLGCTDLDIGVVWVGNTSTSNVVLMGYK